MKPVYNSQAQILAPLQTQAIGTNWSTFESFACNALDVINNSGVDIDVRRNGGGQELTIPAGLGRLMVGITNANQIDIKRADDSNPQVYVQAEALRSA